MVQVLSYPQWKEKHKNSSKYQGLPKAEMKRRYESYVESARNGRDPLSKYLPKNTTKRPPARSGGSGARGKSQVRSQASSLGFKMNPKTHDFLTARTNPFCPRIRDVGYPCPVVGGSLKWRSFARATLQTNDAGFGWLLVCPGMAGWPDKYSVGYSLATNTRTTDSVPPWLSNAGQGDAVGMSGGPMTCAAAATPGPYTFVRTLAVGARIRCDAPLLEKAGSIKTFSLPLIGEDAFGFSGTTLLTDYPNYCQWYQANIADSPWFSTVFSPAFPNVPGTYTQDLWNMEGGAMSINAVNGAATQISCTMGILISGAPNQTYDFEVVSWHEMFGQIILGNSYATSTYADPIGLSIVSGVTQSQSLNTMTKTATGAVEASNVLSAVGQSVKTVLGKIDPMSILSSVFGGAPTNTTANITPTPEVGPELSGYGADAESLAARLAALKMPSVPSASASESFLSDAIPTALEALAL